MCDAVAKTSSATVTRAPHIRTFPFTWVSGVLLHLSLEYLMESEESRFQDPSLRSRRDHNRHRHSGASVAVHFHGGIVLAFALSVAVVVVASQRLPERLALEAATSHRVACSASKIWPGL